MSYREPDALCNRSLCYIIIKKGLFTGIYMCVLFEGVCVCVRASVSYHLADASIAGQHVGVLHDGQTGRGGGGDL